MLPCLTLTSIITFFFQLKRSFQKSYWQKHHYQKVQMLTTKKCTTKNINENLDQRVYIQNKSICAKKKMYPLQINFQIFWIFFLYILFNTSNIKGKKHTKNDSINSVADDDDDHFPIIFIIYRLDIYWLGQ